MFCRYCGKELNKDFKVCPYCGKPTDNTVTNETNNAEIENSQDNDDVEELVEQKTINKTVVSVKKKNAIAGPLIAVGSVIILLIIIFCAVARGSSGASKITSVDQIDWHSQVEQEAESWASAHYNLAYQGYATISITTVSENHDGSYSVYGKATCRDNYGDTYIGNFSMICTVNYEKAQGMINDSTTTETDFTDCVSKGSEDWGTPTRNPFSNN